VKAPTREETEQLAAWLAHLTTNTDPDELQMPPQFYWPVAAWLQMAGAGIVDADSDMKPWNMPTDVAAYFVHVWYAARRAAIAVARNAPPNTSGVFDMKRGSGPLFGGGGLWGDDEHE